MKPSIACLLIIISLLFSGFTQSGPTPDYQALLNKIEESLRIGNKRALRDLGSLLDKPQVSKDAIRLLSRYCLFVQSEFDFSKPITKDIFLNFYYDIENRLDFSDLFQGYYITHPADRKINYKIRAVEEKRGTDLSIVLKEEIKTFKLLLHQNDTSVIIRQIKKIAKLDIEEAYFFLIFLLEDEAFLQSPYASTRQVYKTLVKSLAGFQHMGSVQTIINLLENKKVDEETALPILENLTNVSITSEGLSYKIEHYQHLIDSLGTLDGIRDYGYQKIFPFRISFFENPVDYYGRVLSLSDHYPWIRKNALDDLMISQHPRALYYLAGLLYKNRGNIKSSDKSFNRKLVKRITKLTMLEIGVTDSENKMSFKNYKGTDDVAKLHYLIYWAAHYADYEWDDNREVFVNKFEAIEKTQNYERLFRRLNSRNDSVALTSFLELAEGEPSEVIALAEKYRQMFRNYNETLPSFQYKYLEQLATLTEFCRKNDIPYKADNKASRKFEELLNAKSEKERFELENKLIDFLKLDEITALEFWACIHEKNINFSFSVSRILDRFYSEHWNNILESDEQLRLYLKKAQLLGNIGAIGSCNSYINKFDVYDPAIQSKLQDLLQTESDKGIISQLNQLVVESEEEEGYDLNNFLSDPLSFGKRDIKVLPLPEAKDYPLLVQAIKEEIDPSAIKKILFYIRLHCNIDMVPHLFKLIDDDRILIKKRGLELTVADNLAPLMEQVYKYSFPEEPDAKRFNVGPWKQKWEKDGANYKAWAKSFFEQKLNILANSDSLRIEDLNQITESPIYDPQYRERCLKALKKVHPVKDVRKLNITPKLSVKSDLKYFENFDFSYKVLDDIPKLFEVDDPHAMMMFLEKMSAQFEISEKGTFYNNLFRTGWFSSYLGDGSMSTRTAEKIRMILVEYLNESDFLSEFEEQNTELYIVQLMNIGKSLEQQLQATIQLNVDPTAKAKIQQSIIARINYQEIPVIVKYLDQLSPKLGMEAGSFLSHHFGLPIYNLQNPDLQNKLIKNHQNLSESEFYQYYLKAFGIDFTTSKGNLDFQKIYNILAFDIVLPFVSSIGGKRDDYPYGIIKLLEFHFGDRLGFHEKLNESQTFYAFSSSKRAHAWMTYLKEQGLVKVKKSLPPSFNPTKADY